MYYKSNFMAFAFIVSEFVGLNIQQNTNLTQFFSNPTSLANSLRLIKFPCANYLNNRVQ